MKVAVHLFAHLSRYLPPDARGDGVILDVEPGVTVADVIRRLGVPATIDALTVVNGRDAAPGQVLADGDVLTLFPPLSGG